MKKVVLLLIALLINSTSCTQSRSCPENFAEGAPPEFINQKLAARTTSLCFDGYAAMHSGISRTPLWSAEHLTASRVSDARGMKRQNKFHAEERLSSRDRAELHDYARSGFDRGHMVPSGDMPTATSQYDSFSLANIIPQDPNNNQNLWVGIEESMRRLASSHGELYVITGPIFEGGSVQRLNGRVLVPTYVFKAIYDPTTQEAGAYIARNARGSKYETVSIAELEQRAGINFFPRMDAKIKEAKMALPEPTPYNYKQRKMRATDPVSSTE
jgi:endonuclease G